MQKKEWKDNPSTFYVEAFSRMNDGDYEKAIELLNHALEIYPDYWDARLLLAGAQEARGSIDEAVCTLKESLAITRRQIIQTLNNLAYFYTLLGEYPKAESHYEEVIRMDDQRAGAFYYLACIKARLNKLEEAKPLLQKAVSLEPEYLQDILDNPDFAPLQEEWKKKE